MSSAGTASSYQGYFEGEENSLFFLEGELTL